MGTSAQLLIWVTVSSVIFVLIGVWAVWRMGKFLARKTLGSETKDRSRQCVCGYTLDNLDVPRCPECGRVIGFEVTAEELGLTVDDLRRAQQAKEARQQKDQSSID